MSPITSYMTANPMAAHFDAYMQRKGIKPKRTVDLGIRLKPQRQPMTERELTPQEVLKLFSPEEALTITYVPHFITQCVMYYTDLLTAYAVENRLPQTKKHNRWLKRLNGEYMKALTEEMPDRVFKRFLSLREEYLQMCAPNLQIMYFTFDAELKKHYGYIQDAPAYCYAYIISSLIDFIGEYDRSINRKIADRLGVPCRNNGDARLTNMKIVCDDIIGKYPIGKTPQTELAIKVLVNKAIEKIKTLAD